VKIPTRDRDETRYLAVNETFHEMICSNATLATITNDLRDRLSSFGSQNRRRWSAGLHCCISWFGGPK
jgi:hypothetical protein